MKKFFILSLLFLAFTRPVLAQHVNIDSIVKIVCARNPRKPDNFAINADSLFKRFPFTKPGRERIDLFGKIFVSYGNVKKNIEMGYRILAWAKANHDPILEAVAAAELGTELNANGDKANAARLETEALTAANAANDNQAYGIVYQDAFARGDFTDPQMKYYAFKALKYSIVSDDPMRVDWEYADLADYYAKLKKSDSALYYSVKSLDWAVRANSIFDVCYELFYVGTYQKNDQLKEQYFKAAFTIAQHTNLASALSSSATVLGNYNADKNKIDTAFAYANIAQQKSRQLPVSLQIDPAHLLYKLYLKTRNLDSADKYINRYYELREKYINSEGAVRGQADSFAEKEKQEQVDSTRRLWLLSTTAAFLLVIALIFWRSNRQTRKANTLLAQQKLQTEQTLAELKAAQTQLVQSEKMASLGELTAGIAHEIQNPLNFVNNFSEVNREMLEELNEELKAGNVNEAIALANDIRQNEEKINHHGKRADFIVKGMLEHSRTGTGEKQLTDLNILADEFMKLSYHGLRAKDKSFNADLITNFNENLPKANVIQQDMGRVLLNLFNNAFYAVSEKAKTAGPTYKPEVIVTTSAENNRVIITVKDNGTGIPDAIKEKIMQPFFTTKPTGQGTGLGLSLSYDIVVKGHGGQFTVDSAEGMYTEFVVKIPV